jgi:hypothetical protein
MVDEYSLRLHMLRHSLAELSDGWQRMAGADGPGVLYQAVLRHGYAFAGQPLPPEYRPRTPKYCFANARTLAGSSRRHLAYVEGFATVPDLPIPIHHAWCMDRVGTVIDVTFREPEHAVYLGIPFNTTMIKRFARRGCQPLLVDRFGCVREDVIEALFPALFEAAGLMRAVA